MLHFQSHNYTAGRKNHLSFSLPFHASQIYRNTCTPWSDLKSKRKWLWKLASSHTQNISYKTKNFKAIFKEEIDVNQIYTVKSKKLQSVIFCGYWLSQEREIICKFSNYKLIMSLWTIHTTQQTYRGTRWLSRDVHPHVYNFGLYYKSELIPVRSLASWGKAIWQHLSKF